MESFEKRILEWTSKFYATENEILYMLQSELPPEYLKHAEVPRMLSYNLKVVPSPCDSDRHNITVIICREGCMKKMKDACFIHTYVLIGKS